jgi:hypothetical protein
MKKSSPFQTLRPEQATKTLVVRTSLRAGKTAQECRSDFDTAVQKCGQNRDCVIVAYANYFDCANWP